MIRFSAALALAGMLAGLALPAAAQQEKPQPQTLYKRLGGYDALAAVTDDFLGRLLADKELARFFGGVSKDSQARNRSSATAPAPSNGVVSGGKTPSRSMAVFYPFQRKKPRMYTDEHVYAIL